jgi:hypothetical protein
MSGMNTFRRFRCQHSLCEFLPASYSTTPRTRSRDIIPVIGLFKDFVKDRQNERQHDQDNPQMLDDVSRVGGHFPSWVKRVRLYICCSLSLTIS